LLATVETRNLRYFGHACEKKARNCFGERNNPRHIIWKDKKRKKEDERHLGPGTQHHGPGSSQNYSCGKWRRSVYSMMKTDCPQCGSPRADVN